MGRAPGAKFASDYLHRPPLPAPVSGCGVPFKALRTGGYSGPIRNACIIRAVSYRANRFPLIVTLVPAPSSDSILSFARPAAASRCMALRPNPESSRSKDMSKPLPSSMIATSTESRCQLTITLTLLAFPCLHALLIASLAIREMKKLRCQPNRHAVHAQPHVSQGLAHKAPGGREPARPLQAIDACWNR